MTLALIDGDILAFRCAAASESEEEGIAIWRVEELLDRILNTTGATEFKIYLTGSNNFRKQIYPEYKANRADKPRPVHLPALRTWLIENYQAVVEEDQEADDALGINQTDETIICTIDKDLLMIPGKHYNFVREEFIIQTELEGLRHFYSQCLQGDRSDNIKGIAGIGPKKAEKLLADCDNEQSMFNTVRQAYQNDDEFLMNGRVLWIRRQPNEDWKDHFNALIQE